MQRRFFYRRESVPSTGSVKNETFKEFDATELYCSQCKRAVPVRKRLLLVLPEGDKYEYLCAFCSETVGTKLVHSNDEQTHLII